MEPTKKGFWEKLWEEVEPIATHSFCVLSLCLSLFLIAFILLVLEYIFPEKKEYLSYAKTIDIWVILVLLSLFGVYTIILVAGRLFRNIKNEWSNGK